MSTTVPSHVTAICPGCGRRGRAPIVHAGRRTKCPGCGERFTIPSPDDAELLRETVDQRPAPKKPEPLVGFDCRVCQTRMSVATQYIGKKVKCPDCGVATVVPEPPPPRQPDIPKAMFADQYEVFEEEEQPWGSDLAAKQPKIFELHCRVCQTLMHAPAEQVGKKLVCPDCGVQTKVEPPTQKETPFDAMVEGYDVDPPEIADEQSEVTRAYLEPLKKEAAEYAAKLTERPELPRAPLLVGVLPMLRSGEMIGRWLVLSAWLTVAGCLLAYAASTFGSVGGGLVAIGAGAIMGVCIGLVGALIGVLSFGYFSALVIGMVTESSEGNQKLQEPPSTNPTDWFGEAITVGLGIMAAAAPGYLGGQLTGWSLAIAAPAGLATLVLFYPVVLLSQLDIGSPLAFFSPRLFGSLLRMPGSWLLLTIESIALAVVPVAAVGATTVGGVIGVAIFSAPVLAAALLYYRLLGRLAWVVAERSSPPPAEQPPADRQS